MPALGEYSRLYSKRAGGELVVCKPFDNRLNDQRRGGEVVVCRCSDCGGDAELGANQNTRRLDEVDGVPGCPEEDNPLPAKSTAFQAGAL